MNFNNPHWFWWLIPVVLLVLILAAVAGKRKKAQLKMLLGAAADDPDAVRLSKGIRKFRLCLLLLTVFFLLAAAARPYWTSRMIPFSQQGRDIMVLFDVSKSMLASDIAPTRLDHARFMLRELVKSDPLDRFGLVAFAGTAYTVCPLTSDPVAFEQYIDELNPDLVPVGGTNLELALKAATRAFKAAGGSNRAIVLFTDGDELEGDSKKFLAELKQRNTPLFIVGLGDPQAGAPVPDGKGGFQRDEAGKLITTKLAENKLIQAAEATGGIYIRSTVTDTGIKTLEKRIQKLDLAERESTVRTIPVEKFPQALICAAFFLFCYLVISERPRAKKMFVFLMLALFVCGAAENPVKKETAPQVAVSEKLPENIDALYNLARKRQTEGREDAVKLYENVLKKAEKRPDLQARSYFNIGTGVHSGGQEAIAGAVSQVQAQQLDPALEKLKEAEKRLAAAEELYTRSVALPPAQDFKEQISGNLQILESDRRKIQELKKKIEDLKKQQKQARQDAKNARDKNQQNKQQQNKQQQQQQNKQQQNQAIDKAQQSARDLQKKADELKQNKMSEQAKKAQEELKKARQARDEKTKQQHLSEAVKALGEEDKKDQPQKDDKQQKQDSRSKESPQKLPAQPQAGKEEKDKADEKSAEQLLKMLNDEEKQRREDLMKMRQMRRTPVRKDW